MKRKDKFKKRQLRAAKKRKPVLVKRTSGTFQLHAFGTKVVLVALRGALGHGTGRAVAEIDELQIGGALEDANEMREIVFKCGIASLACLLGYPVGTKDKDGKEHNIQGMMEALAGFAGINIEEIKAELAKDREEEVRAEHDAMVAQLEAEEAAKATQELAQVDAAITVMEEHAEALSTLAE